MPFFTSSKEARLWLYVLITLIAIATSLFVSNTPAILELNDRLQVIIFVLGIFLVIISIVLTAIQSTSRPHLHIGVLLAVGTIYLMLFLRLSLAERSHLIEYSVLSLLIHRALVERTKKNERWFLTAFIAILVTTIIGALDESVQILLTYRIFDINDILFNGLAAFFAVASVVAVKRLQLSKKK